MMRGLLCDHSHTLFNRQELIKNREHHTRRVFTVFDLLIQENTHTDVHMCWHDYQMLCINIYVDYADHKPIAQQFNWKPTETSVFKHSMSCGCLFHTRVWLTAFSLAQWTLKCAYWENRREFVLTKPNTFCVKSPLQPLCLSLFTNNLSSYCLCYTVIVFANAEVARGMMDLLKTGVIAQCV